MPSIVFFGNEKLATGIAEPPRRGLEALKAAGYEIEAAITGKLESDQTFSSKLGVLAAYGHILPQTVIDLFPLGIINIHPSLLPIYRGPTPVEQAILDGAGQTGVSIMKLVSKMDAGPVLAQQKIDLSGDESKQELADRLHKVGAGILVNAVDHIFNDQAKSVDQDESKATFCRKITKADGEINWQKPADVIEREIRAYLGWPGSYTKLLNSDVIITATRVTDGSGKPGETSTDNKQLTVYAGKGALLIERIKPAGKREMSAQEFLAGHRR